MISRQEAFEGFYGAWRLFFRDQGAAALFDDSISGCWKSFSCAIFVLPLYIPMVLFGAGSVDSARGPIEIAAIEMVFYVIGWVMWPLMMAYIVPILDRDKDGQRCQGARPGSRRWPGRRSPCRQGGPVARTAGDQDAAQGPARGIAGAGE